MRITDIKITNYRAFYGEHHIRPRQPPPHLSYLPGFQPEAVMKRWNVSPWINFPFEAAPKQPKITSAQHQRTTISSTKTQEP